ncbi:MAG: hypothetical protein M3R00_04810 [Pseudomonadota bacterium]|nr:hypothetical protein [Pseudomonadota bacterium]
MKTDFDTNETDKIKLMQNKQLVAFFKELRNKPAHIDIMYFFKDRLNEMKNHPDKMCYDAFIEILLNAIAIPEWECFFAMCLDHLEVNKFQSVSDYYRRVEASLIKFHHATHQQSNKIKQSRNCLVQDLTDALKPVFYTGQGLRSVVLYVDYVIYQVISEIMNKGPCANPDYTILYRELSIIQDELFRGKVKLNSYSVIPGFDSKKTLSLVRDLMARVNRLESDCKALDASKAAEKYSLDLANAKISAENDVLKSKLSKVRSEHKSEVADMKLWQVRELAKFIPHLNSAQLQTEIVEELKAKNYQLAKRHAELAPKYTILQQEIRRLEAEIRECAETLCERQNSQSEFYLRASVNY